MGVRFRKSINLGGGARLNLSKKGVGMSMGTKGFRVGVGPRGITKTASIPGTGISYRTETSLKTGRQASNREVQYNNMYYELPEGVYIPKVKANVAGFITAGILVTILGMFFVPLLLVAIILLLIGFKNMLFDKDYKSALHTQLAIRQYKKGHFASSAGHIEKALKYVPDNEPANKLLYHLINM